MPSHTYFDAELRVIRSEFEGDVTEQDILKCAGTIARIHGETSVRIVLSNTTKVKSLPGTSAVFAAINKFEELGLQRIVREATVVSPGIESAPEMIFFKTTCHNRGYITEFFADEASALAWLKQHP